MAKNDETANNGGQGDLDVKVMAEALGITVEELTVRFMQKVSDDPETRDTVLNQTALIQAGMSPEERVLQDEIAKIEASAITHRAFSEPQPIPESWQPKMTEWFEAGLMPPAVLVHALSWLSLNDRISTEATYGRHFDGKGLMVTYMKRLANARRRAFVPNLKKFGPTTLSVNGQTTQDIREFLEWCSIKVPGSGSTVSTYFYRAVRDKKVPADTRIHNLAIPGCTSDGVSVSLARYFEWFENHRADVANGVILGKDGEMIEISDYEASLPDSDSDLSEDDDDDGDSEEES